MLRNLLRFLVCSVTALWLMLLHCPGAANAQSSGITVTLEEDTGDSAEKAPKKAESKKKRKKKRKKKKKIKRKPRPTEKAARDEGKDEQKKHKAKPAKVEAKQEKPAKDAGGVECEPIPKKLETRRPLPILCRAKKKPMDDIEVRYRPEGTKDWEKVSLNLDDKDWVGEIPCTASFDEGTLEVQIRGMRKSKEAGRLETIEVEVLELTDVPPPSLPGKLPPPRCFTPSDCPPDLVGSPVCPNTEGEAGGGGNRSWGAACTLSKQCETGLACVNGTCETPPSCDSGEECSSGVCEDGLCVFLDPEEAAARLGSPKHHWIGLHFAADVAFVSEAVGVCGDLTGDAENYTCFSGGEPYTAETNRYFGGDVGSGPRLATMRALLSYEYAFKRVTIGTRLGFAFRGAPEDFTPIHIEGRFQYALRADPLQSRLRPYLGVVAGLGQVDVSSRVVNVIECPESNQACIEQADPNQLTPSGAVDVHELDAYRHGSRFFFGPSLSLMYAFTNDSAIKLNVNVLFPDLIIQPSLGYVMGL